MIETLKNLTRHSTIYGLGALLNRVLGFILLPIYTRYLTPSDYGILSLMTITGAIVGVIAQLSLGSAMFRELIYEESDERTVESTTFYFLVGESVLFFGVLIAFSPQLSSLIFKIPDYADLLRLIFLTGLLNVLNVVVMARLRIHEQSGLYSTLSVGNFLVGATLNIYFIVVLQRGVEGVVMAGLISAILFALLCLSLLFRDLRLVFSVSILRRMLSYGIPMVPARLSNQVMTSADRYFLQHLSTTTEVGLYSLGYSVGMVINLMVQAFQIAWRRQIFVIAKQPDAEQQFAKMLTYYLLVLGFMGLGLSVLGREVLVIMTTPKFYAAFKVVPLIILSYLFYGVRFITNTALETQNRMKYVPPIIIGSALLNMVLNYLLIPRYGMMGAAWATVIAYVSLAFFQTAINQYFWHIPYEYKRIGKIVLVWGMIYGASLLIQSPNTWLNGGLKLVLLVTYPFFLYLLRFYEKQELIAIKRLFQSRVYWIRNWSTGS
ncbi:MAG: lipopolysaccharide biosynthesis protein [Candidatus Hodarchaeota archaeon]